MTPVLTSLRDYVLYLKHNLNAQAVGALKQEIGSIEAEVDDLIAEIRKSIGSLFGFGDVRGFDIRSLLIAVGGAVILLVGFRLVKK